MAELDRSKQPLTVAINAEKSEALIISPDGWPLPLPSAIRLKHGAAGIEITTDGGRPLGIVPLQATVALMQSTRMFLGSVKDGELESDGLVQSTWDGFGG